MVVDATRRKRGPNTSPALAETRFSFLPSLTRLSSRNYALVILLIMLFSTIHLFVTSVDSYLSTTMRQESTVNTSSSRYYTQNTTLSCHEEVIIPRKLAFASFVDHQPHIYGTYSILHQINRTGMNIPYVVVTSKDFTKRNPGEYSALVDMIGRDYIQVVNRNYIIGKIKGKSKMWKGVFNKLWLFNLTDYDKIIVLDQDVLIRTNIMHWFDYPAPAATQAGDQIEWNSGAMVIEPNQKVFDTMIDLLPMVSRFDAKRPLGRDNWSSSYSDQAFLSSFFTQETLNKTTSLLPGLRRMSTLPTEAAILSSSLGRPQMQYFFHHRQHIFETIHFTTDKPWKTTTKNPAVCAMLMEWKLSMDGFNEKYDNLTKPIYHEYVDSCPKSLDKPRSK